MLQFKVIIIALLSAIIPITVSTKNITNAPAALQQNPFRFPQYPPFPMPFPGLMPASPGVPPVPFGAPLVNQVPGAKAAPMPATSFFPPFFPGMIPNVAPPSHPMASPKLPKAAPLPAQQIPPPLPFGPFPPIPLPPGGMPPVAPMTPMAPAPAPAMLPTFGPMPMQSVPVQPMPMQPMPMQPMPLPVMPPPAPVPFGPVPLATVPVPQTLPVLPTTDNYYCSAFASIAVSQATTLKPALMANFVPPPPVAASRDDDVEVGIARLPDSPPMQMPLNAPVESRQYCRYTAVTSPASCTTCCQAAAHFGRLHADHVKGLLLLFDPEKPPLPSVDVGIAARKRRAAAGLFANGPPITKSVLDTKKRYQCMCCAPRTFIEYQY